MARILVVENDPDQLDIRCLILDREGHTVYPASTVEQALAAPHADKALVDLRMPTLEDGCRLIRELRALQPSLEILVLSGLPEPLRDRPELNLIARALQKPVPTKLLLSLLALAAGLFAQPESAIRAHSPILERRANVIGTDSDVPLLMYAERPGDNSIQYTVIFSNEDGGTSTRALMARWGRVTDIEYVYRVWLDDAGNRTRATIQGKNHQELTFTGPFEADHPLLRVITDNNMVGPGGSGAPRTVLEPIVVDLSHCSREQVMDDHPELYKISFDELEREGKTHLIGEPRRYLFVEARIENSGQSRTFLRAKVKGVHGKKWYASHDGQFDWAIERSGWVRTTIQLPAGAVPTELSFGCLKGECHVPEVRKAFFLDENYKPKPNLNLKWSSTSK